MSDIDRIVKGTKSTLDELQGLLERKIQDLDTTKTRVDALRAEAEVLWSAQGARLEEIEAIQTTIQLLGGGHTSELPTWRSLAADTAPGPLASDDPDADLNLESTHGHTTVLDIGQLAQSVLPPTAHQIVAEALRTYGKAIHRTALAAIIHQTHPEIANGSISTYLSELYRQGLAERTAMGTYFWVGDQEEEKDE